MFTLSWVEGKVSSAPQKKVFEQDVRWILRLTMDGKKL